MRNTVRVRCGGGELVQLGIKGGAVERRLSRRFSERGVVVKAPRLSRG